MKARSLWPRLIPFFVLLAFFAIALWVRIGLPFSQVFTSNGIIFTGNDAYYHMRVVQSLVDNFPHFPKVDPYLQFGSLYTVIPSFFQWLLASVIWVIGLGHPSQHLIDLIGAYYPAVLGALTVIPAFFIGKGLWGRHGVWAGAIAAGLVALLPGEFLGRSILGFTDQHVMETLLSTTAMMFLIYAVKWARERQITFRDILKPGWGKIGKPALFSLLSGLFLGLYIFSWQGALLVVFAVAAFLVVQFVVDHLKGRSTDYLAFSGGLVFLVTLLFLPVAPGPLYLPSLTIGLLVAVALGLLSWFMASRKLPRILYPAVVVVGGVGGLGLLYLADPQLVRNMLAAFNIFTPSGTLLATIEAQSIFTPVSGGTGFFDSPAWINFYFALPLAFLGLVILLGRYLLRHGKAEYGAFIVWSLVMLVATAGQRRFAYYFAINVALLAAYAAVLFYYLLDWVLAYTGGDQTRTIRANALELEGLTVKEPAAEATAVPRSKKARRRELQIQRRRELQRRRLTHDQAARARLVRQYVSVSVSCVVMFFVLFSPLIVFPDKAHGLVKAPAIATAASAPYAPSDGWMKALTWMADNTTEPLGSAADYYKHYDSSFTYPASAYSVTAWWDYGYWITYIGHRIPSANPGQSTEAVTRVARFLTAQDEASAEAIANEMKTGYVVLDYQTVTSKFWAVAQWAGQKQSDYFEVYWNPKTGQQELLIYPAYYQSMAARLYSFNGTAQAGTNPLVVEYRVVNTPQGSYKEIVSEHPFSTYAEAKAFMDSQTSGNFTLVGGLAPGSSSSDPLVSPVPLEALQHYKLVYSTQSMVYISTTAQTPEIDMFQRLP